MRGRRSVHAFVIIAHRSTISEHNLFILLLLLLPSWDFLTYCWDSDGCLPVTVLVLADDTSVLAEWQDRARHPLAVAVAVATGGA